MPGFVDVASSAARGLIDRGVEYGRLRGSNDLTQTALLLLPVLYMVYRKLYCQTFGRLSSMPAGAGKQGNNWLKVDGKTNNSDVVEVTWLSAEELKVLQAFGDTLLPGFEMGTKEAADAVVEQVGGVCVATTALSPLLRP